MTAVTTDTENLEELTGIDELVPRCELAPLDAIRALFATLAGKADEAECGNRARWQLFFACSRPTHGEHHYLVCDPHHDALTGASQPTKLAMRWAAL